MTFRIHFNIDGDEDSFVVQGESLKDIRAKAKQELDARGLDVDRHNVWSEKV